MVYFRKVVKRRSACMTDEEIAELSQKAREHALDLQLNDPVWGEPVLPRNVLCWWCRTMHAPAEVSTCMAMKRPESTQTESLPSSSSVTRGELLSAFAELWEFLTLPKYGDGKPRQTGHLSLRLTQHGLMGTLTDPSSGSYSTLIGSSLDELFLAWEVGLKEGTLAWRKSTYSRGRK